MAFEVGTPVRGAILLLALRRSWVLILVIMLLGGALGFAAGSARNETVAAKATVLVTPLEGNPFSPSGSGNTLTNLQTEAKLVSSDAVAQLTSEALGSHDSDEDLLSGLKVTVPPNTQILEIEYTASDKDTAILRAQGFAEAFLEYRRSRSEAQVTDRTSAIQGQIELRLDEFEELLAELEAAQDPSPERALLQEQIDSVSTQIGQLRMSLIDLGSGSVDPGQVVTPAAVGPQGFLDSRVLFAVGGLVLGLVAGLALVVLRSRQSASVHDVGDIEAAGLPLLGEVQLADLVAGAGGDPNAGRALEEGFRDIRVTLLTEFRSRPLRVLLASANDDQGPPLTGWGLGESTAQSTLDTVLIDASGDLPGGALSGRDGLKEVLLGQSSLSDSIVTINDHFRALPMGSADGEVDNLFLAPAMSSLLGEVGQRGDVLLIVTGSIQGAQARALAACVDVVIVEAGEGVTTMRDLAHLAALRRLPASLGGIIYVEGSRRMRRLARVGRHAAV